MMTIWTKGADLSPALQREVKARFTHRYTGEHVPTWVRKGMNNGQAYPLQFKDDNDWLANSYFPMTKEGRLHLRIHHCNSHPTWPNGK